MYECCNYLPNIKRHLLDTVQAQYGSSSFQACPREDHDPIQDVSSLVGGRVVDLYIEVLRCIDNA